MKSKKMGRPLKSDSPLSVQVGLRITDDMLRHIPRAISIPDWVRAAIAEKITREYGCVGLQPGDVDLPEVEHD